MVGFYLDSDVQGGLRLSDQRWTWKTMEDTILCT